MAKPMGSSSFGVAPLLRNPGQVPGSGPEPTAGQQDLMQRRSEHTAEDSKDKPVLRGIPKSAPTKTSEFKEICFISYLFLDFIQKFNLDPCRENILENIFPSLTNVTSINY